LKSTLVVLLLLGVAGALRCDRAQPLAPAPLNANASRKIATTAPPPAHPGFSSIAFTDVLQGWVVGAGVVASTRDGGATWQRVDARLASVPTFTSTDIGWGLGADGLVRTVDMGKTWSNVPVPRGDVQSAAFTGNRSAWLVVQDPVTRTETLLHTVDVGVHWDFVATPGRPLRLCARDDANLWLMAAQNGLFETSDGGQKWAKVALPIPVSQRDFTDSGSILSCGQDDTWAENICCVGAFHQGVVLYRMGDHDRTWSAVLTNRGDLVPGIPQIPFAAPGAASFPSATVGLVTGDCGPCQANDHASLYATTDGGASWHAEQVPPMGDDLTWSIAFVDADHGWIATSGGGVFHTDDGGQTWRLQFESSSLPAD
jgi:photosystem II stability/assembly factor-like uncharacterized protein